MGRTRITLRPKPPATNCHSLAMTPNFQRPHIHICSHVSRTLPSLEKWWPEAGHLRDYAEEDRRHPSHFWGSWGRHEVLLGTNWVFFLTQPRHQPSRLTFCFLRDLYAGNHPFGGSLLFFKFYFPFYLGGRALPSTHSPSIWQSPACSLHLWVCFYFLLFIHLVFLRCHM